MFFLFIDTINPGVTEAELGRVIPAHIDWLNDQFAAGAIVQAGKWGDIGGMVIYRAESLDQAQALVETDPLVASGLIEYRLDVFYPMKELD